MVNGYILIAILTFFVSDHYAMVRQNGARGKKSVDVHARFIARQAAQNAIAHSIIKEDPKALEAALRNRLADPNKIVDNNLPPIIKVMLGCNDIQKRKRMVQILLKYKADPNIPYHRDPKGHKDRKEHIGLFPLHVAVSKQDPELVRMLLQAHARVHVLSEVLPSSDPDKITNVQSMPLHYACDPGVPLDFDIVRMLVQAGACIDMAEEGSKSTPLHLAVVNGNVQAVAFLLKKGALAYKVNAKGFTPVHDAVIRDDVSVVWILSKHTDMNHRRRHPDETIHKQIMALMQTMDEKQLYRAKKIHKPYHLMIEGYTPLHLAISYASTQMLQELLALGADPNSEALFGIRPLHLAVYVGEVTQEIRRQHVQALLAAGADLDVQAHVHINRRLICTTPLLLALRMNFFDLVDDLCAWYTHHQRTIKTPHISYTCAVLKNPELSFESKCALIQRFITLGDNLAYTDNFGNILHIAVSLREDPCMIEHLIRLGVLVDQPNEIGFTPYDVALCLDEKPLIDCLKPYEAARLSQLHAIVTGDSNGMLEQEAQRTFDSRIGDITRLHEYMLFFKDTPGIRSIMRVLNLCGTQESLKKYAPAKKQGAINTARGALFELNAAYHLMLERHEINALRAKYEGLEYDIETPEYLVECKNIAWSTIVGRRINELKDSLQRHNDVVKRLGKKYMLYSKNPIPTAWQTWLARQDIEWVEYEDVPSPSQNKIREQYLMPLLIEQTELCQKTSSSYQ